MLEKELLPLLKSQGLSFRMKGRVYDACVLTEMLHDNEIGTLNAGDT